jgi:hypothetical protein
MHLLNMDNHAKTFQVDEVDLRELFLTLWHGKIYILFYSILFFFLSSMYLQNAERKYLVEYKIKPVGENQQKNSFSGLGGIASLAGIQLPSNSMNDFKIFKELILSVEVSEIILKNKELIKKIYDNEWNPSLNSFAEPSKNILKNYIDASKRIITGDNEVIYKPPNARRLATYISKNISINEVKETGFLTLKAETSKPDMLLLLIAMSVEASDEIMRQRYIGFSKEPLDFYKEKLRTARSREHREVLAELISKEEQKLMFASKGKYFIAEPYIEPTISLYPVAPKPVLILFFSVILGSLTGCGIVIYRSVLARDKK